MQFSVYKSVSDLKRLVLEQYDFPVVKRLLKSKKFDYVQIDSDIFERAKNTHIDTEELVIDEVPLRDILRCKFFKTKSLICKDFFVQFDNDLKVNVR